MLVDVWTMHADEPEAEARMLAVLESGADQITSPDAAVLAARFSTRWP